MSITVQSTTDTKENVTVTNAVAPEKEVSSPKEDEAKKSEPADKADETTAESETADNDETESEDEGESSEEKLEASTEKPKIKQGFKRKIDKLLKRASAAEQEKEYWRAEALKTKNPAPGNQDTKETKVEIKGEPKADDFETHVDYVKALAKWTVSQEREVQKAQDRESQLKTEQQKRIGTYLGKVKEFAKDHSDFDELMEDTDDIKMSLTVEEVLLDSDNGPALAYELAKNREEYERICKLPAIAAARELGKIEARIAKSAESSTETTETKTTKAPKPISPVNSKSAAVKKSIYDPDLSQADFEKLRRQQIAQR